MRPAAHLPLFASTLLALLAACNPWPNDPGTPTDTGSSSDPDTDTGADDTDSGPGKDTGKDTGEDTGKDTGKDTDEDTGEDTGEDTDSGVHHDSGDTADTDDSGVGTRSAWYIDIDADGFGSAEDQVWATSQPVGYVADSSDCDDHAAATHPGASELCNGIDDDCDARVDGPTALGGGTWYPDADQDGYGEPGAPVVACEAPAGFVAVTGDCDDTNAATYEGAMETCNGVDDDCDGTVDEWDAVGAPLWYVDVDGDFHGDPTTAIPSCAAPAGRVDIGDDCNDRSFMVFPGAQEICDGLDNDCDGTADGGVGERSWYPDADGDGYGATGGAVSGCDRPEGYVEVDGDCDDNAADVSPAGVELCDGIDNDCDGAADDGGTIGGSIWYADADGDGHGDPAVTVESCTAPEGYVATADDCDDTAAAAFPGADELCDGLDNDCNGTADNNDASDAIVWYRDYDVDGFGDTSTPYRACAAPAGYSAEGGDCDDHDSDVNPGVVELCNGLDDDCDATIDEPDAADAVALHADVDGDGHGDPGTETVGCPGAPGVVEDESDCDDTNAKVFPGAAEVCNGLDDDCNGEVDVNPTDARLYYVDADGDTYGEPSIVIESCKKPEGYSLKDTDCDDTNAAVFPNAVETCDGLDQDCNGAVDDAAIDAGDWYTDADGDGHGVAGTGVNACEAPAGTAALDDDCDDGEANSFPGNPEICDGIDDDCDGSVDINAEGAPTWFRDGDADGYGDRELVACDQPEGYVDVAGDCDDRHADAYPGAPEICDAADNDCDDQVDEVEDLAEADWYADSDGDGFGDPSEVVTSCEAPVGYVADNTDCDDKRDTTFPGADEACDGDDNDCDGTVDDPDVVAYSSWYADSDKDGYGDPAVEVSACARPRSYVADASDCDDTTDAISPDAAEQCDEIDNNCDGQVDEVEGALITAWYADEDGDGQGNPDVSVPSCIPLDGYIDNADDCDDSDRMVHVGADERCNAVDDDCDGTINEDDAVDATVWFIDSDADGAGSAAEVYAACSMPDGYAESDDDCDDADPDLSPSATELCDGLDNNCDGTVDEDGAEDGVTWYADNDADGFGNSRRTVVSCGTPEGWLLDATDCDDRDSAVFPGAPEICNDQDDDCNELVDDGTTIGAQTWYADLDGDGFGDAATAFSSCSTPEDSTEDATDCDDSSADVNPEALELCNTIDDNCDGSIDGDDSTDKFTWYLDADEDGYGDELSTIDACYAPIGYTSDAADCDDSLDAVNPDADEDCATAADDDCDGLAPRCGPFGHRPLSDADAQLRGGLSGDAFGTCVDLAPDLDGDGKDDVVIGATGLDSGSNEGGGAFVYGTALDGTVDTSAAVAEISSTLPGGLGGRSVQGIGDANGDGFGDLLVGAHTSDIIGVESGGAWLLYGPVTGDLDLTTANVTLPGERAGDWLGYAVSGGDLDGDGLSDLMISAPYEDTGGSRAGAVYLMGVDGAGVSAKVIGEQALDRAGTSVSSPGDVDGDGIADVLIGAWGESSIGRNAGAAYVLYGPYASVMDLGSADAKLTGEARNDAAGMAVAGPGDMDGDGLADILVGADGSGTSYLVTGAPSGSSSLGDATAVIDSESGRDHAGWSLDGAGDIDNDGARDLIIGAYGYVSGANHLGASYLLCGPLEGMLTLKSADARLVGTSDQDQAGASVAGGSDLDGDGFDDVLIGAWGADPNGSASGLAYLFYGGER